MAAAQLDAVYDAFVKSPPIGGGGDGRMGEKTGEVCGPVLEELGKTMPAVMQGIPPHKKTWKLSNKCTAYNLHAGFRLESALFVPLWRTLISHWPVVNDHEAVW
jgi:hypothetical protein